MKLTAILIVSDALRTVLKDLVKGLEELETGGRAENIQTTALLNIEKNPGDRRRFIVTHSSERLSVDIGVKNLQSEI